MRIQDMYSIWSLLFGNITAKQTIVKNVFWMGLGTGITKLLTLGLLIYAARVLGAQGYGQFTFALAFVSLFAVFSNLGLSSIIVREFASEKGNKEEFYSIFSLKIMLTLGALFLMGVASFLITPAKEVQMIILILALFVLVSSLFGICYAFFHARQKMEYEAWFETAQALIILGLGLFVLLRIPSPLNLSYVYFFSALATSAFVFVFFHRKIFPLKVRWDFSVWKKFLKMSWPLALIGLFGAVYSYTDSVMLGYWGMLEETGWYNAAYKIVQASLIPMGLIGAAFYPALSRFFSESKEKLQKAWNYEIEIVIALAVPLVVGGVLLASNIIRSFYPADFFPATLAFQILIGTAGLILLYRPLYDAMIVLNQQTKTFWITTAGAIVNVALNLFLIPKYSLYGAAVATVCTHALTLVIVLGFLKKFTFMRLPVLRIVLTFAFSVLSVFVMYVVLQYILAYTAHVFLLIVAGVLAYSFTFFVLRKYIALRYFQYAYI